MKENNYTIEEKKMMQTILKRVAVSTALSYAVIAGVIYCLINEKIDLARYQNIKAENLTEIGPRIQYVLQHSTPGIVWLNVCFFLVISKRLFTPAMNPLSGHENRTTVAKNIFLNSLEQFVLSFTSQLVLVTYLTPVQVLNIISVINIVFIIGRICFWLGYPINRAFGTCINFIPTTATIVYISYRYFTLFIKY